jgi:hypothetical protein
MPVSHQIVGVDEVRLALQRVRASETFSRSPQLSRLLAYLCGSLLTHGADPKAEFVTGMEADFDLDRDAVAQAELHRLRRRLRDYYLTEGATDAVRIVIPPGQYVAVAVRTGEGPATTPEIATVQTAEPSGRPATTRPLFPPRPILWMLIVAAIVLVASELVIWSH